MAKEVSHETSQGAEEKYTSVPRLAHAGNGSRLIRAFQSRITRIA